MKIVADSSADLLHLKNVDFAVAPLKILAGEQEFVDNGSLDVNAMVEWFQSYKGRSQTSCPNPGDWLQAFGDAENIFCVTITSGLSGSCNAAKVAAQMYEAEHPGRQVRVIDSLSAGPELVLLVEKLEVCMEKNMCFADICQEIEAYQKQTGLLFVLESLKNFAANGRVSPAVAKIAGMLGIRIVGRASLQGTLEPLHKCRGAQKALQSIVAELQAAGFAHGKVRIAHCENLQSAEMLKKMIQEQIGEVDIQIHACRGLWCYYQGQEKNPASPQLS